MCVLLEAHINKLKLSPFRAAEKGNFEAAVKLGIAYLYNEGRKFNTWQLPNSAACW